MHSRSAIDPDHRNHDRPLIARHAAGDAYPGESEAAEALISGCPDCALLDSDMRLLATINLELPPVRRPRDFRISADEAERLRGSWLERLMRGIAAPGWAVRPLAGAALALGLFLIVLGALPAPGQAPVSDAGALAPVATDAARVFAEPSSLPAAQQQPTDQTAQVELDAASPPAEPSSISQLPAPQASAGAANDLAPATQAPPPVEGIQQLPEVTLAPGDEGGTGNGTSATEGEPSPATIAAQGPDEPGESQIEPGAAPISSDLNTTVTVGLLLAATGLVVLLAVWYARRRYADPLTR